MTEVPAVLFYPMGTTSTERTGAEGQGVETSPKAGRPGPGPGQESGKAVWGK